MGVKSLWTVLAPTARSVTLQDLRGKIVAVDASIWLVQFIKAMRDSSGDMIEGGPLIGLLRRLCRLLYHGIKPIIVFDGMAPSLKIGTLQKRRNQRAKNEKGLFDAAQRLLLNEIHGRVLRNELGPNDVSLNEDRDEEDRAGSVSSSDNDSDDRHAEWLDESGDVISNLGGISPTSLAALPPPTQFSLLQSIKRKQAQLNRERYTSLVGDTSGVLLGKKTRAEVLGMVNASTKNSRDIGDSNNSRVNPQSFSQMQIQNYLSSARINRKINELKEKFLQSAGGYIGDDEEEQQAHASETLPADNGDITTSRSVMMTSTSLIPPWLIGLPLQAVASDGDHGVVHIKGRDNVAAVMATMSTIAFPRPQPRHSEPDEDGGFIIDDAMTYPSTTMRECAVGSITATEAEERDGVVDVIDDENYDGVAYYTNHNMKVNDIISQNQLYHNEGMLTDVPSIDVPSIDAHLAEAQERGDTPIESEGGSEDEWESICPRHHDISMDITAPNADDGWDSSSIEAVDQPVLPSSIAVVVTKGVEGDLEVGMRGRPSPTVLDAIGEASDKIFETPLHPEEDGPLQRLAANPQVQTSKHEQNAVHEAKDPSCCRINEAVVDHLDEDDVPTSPCTSDNDGMVKFAIQATSPCLSNGAIVPPTTLPEAGSEFRVFPLPTIQLQQLQEDRDVLQRMEARFKRDSEVVDRELLHDCEILLQLLGVPFLVAPAEAEAQCASLSATKQVDVVISDDNDALLFGANVVCRHVFSQSNSDIEMYSASSISRDLGLDRPSLIRLALLLGGDYGDGVRGVGIVNGMEILHAFPGEDGLQEFRDWMLGNSKDEDSCEIDDDMTIRRRQFYQSHQSLVKRWSLPSNFPSQEIINAYKYPTVDASDEPFSWAFPNLDGLRQFCFNKMRWSPDKTDEIVLPAIKMMSERGENGHVRHQKVLEDFSQFGRVAIIRSKRLTHAVGGITGGAAPLGVPPQHLARGKRSVKASKKLNDDHHFDKSQTKKRKK